MKEFLYNKISEIELRLDDIKEKFEVSEEIKDFLLNLASNQYETLEEVKDIANKIYMKL